MENILSFNQVIMKLYFLSILSFLTISLKAQSHDNLFRTNLIVDYHLTNKGFKESMILLIGKKTSLFSSKKKMFNDSIVRAMKGTYINPKDRFNELRSKMKKNKYEYKIFKKSNKILATEKFMTESYLYEEKLNLKWKVSNDTLTVGGFVCNKALVSYAGRDYIAWFTKDIPISEGPYKFRGLPGLILKIYDKDKNYIFEVNKVVEKEIEYYFDSDDFIKTTKKEFFNKIVDFKENPIPYLQQIGIVFNEELKERAKQRAKLYKSNPIELKIN